jgi:phospholipase C
VRSRPYGIALLVAAAMVTGAVAPVAVESADSSSASAGSAATTGPIGHVIVVMMENRSFDHMLGWLPGGDGQQAGLTYEDSTGAFHDTYHLGSDWQGCNHSDPLHSYEGGRIEWNGGACDGWLFASTDNDEYAIGYYTADDLPLYAGLAANWTTCDRYFSPIMASTFCNKLHMWAADTDRLASSITPFPSELPTIFDRLSDAGLSGRYYYTDVPFTALWGTRYLTSTRPISSFFADAAAGNLPHVAFIDPKMRSEPAGTSCDDHPFADIRCGQDYVNDVYEAVINSPNWPDAVLVITYDEWGGFFDHVDPDDFGRPPVPPAQGLLDLVEPGLRGFRVPTFLISPWAPRGAVDHGVYDHASILRMIEWNWDLTPLTVRDETANNLADALDFGQHSLDAPHFTISAGPFNPACPPPHQSSSSNDFEAVLDLAVQLGFPTVEPCWASAGVNGFTTLPLHAELSSPPDPCDIGDPCGSGTINTNVSPTSTHSIYLLARNHDGITGVQTAFDWGFSWVLLSSQWDCQTGQLVDIEPSGAGATDGTIRTTFDCVTGPETVVIGRLSMLGASGCLSQVESSYPMGTHVLGCGGEVTGVNPGCRGRICVGLGGVNACYSGIVSPVEVSAFEASGVTGGVLLSWRLTGGSDAVGFNVLASDQAQGDYVRRNQRRLAAHEREYLDETDHSSFYKLEIVERDGSRHLHGPVQGIPGVPSGDVSRVQTQPNPFRLSTDFRFEAPAGEPVTIDIYDPRGQFVARIHDGVGPGLARWDGRDASGHRVPAGVYFYRLKVGGELFVDKMVVLSAE